MNHGKIFGRFTGSWEGIHGNGIYVEEWTRINECELSGVAYVKSEGKITGSEKLMLKSDGDHLYYIADVKHNPAPVFFKLAYCDDSKVVFENREHEFPQKITYLFNSADSLTAVIESVDPVDKRKFTFDLNRVKY